MASNYVITPILTLFSDMNVKKIFHQFSSKVQVMKNLALPGQGCPTYTHYLNNQKYGLLSRCTFYDNFRLSNTISQRTHCPTY